MKRELDWNDHIKDFIKIKLQRPYVLEELVRRESEFAKKRQAEQKIEALRNKYQQLTKEFRKHHNQHEDLVELKQKLQKDVTELNGHIIKLEVQVEKQVHQIMAQHPKQETTRQSINSDSFSLKKQEECVAILAEQTSTKESVSTQIAQLQMRNSALNEDYQNSVEMLQEQLNKKQAQQQFKIAEMSLSNLQGKLQFQKEKRKTLMTSISEAENRTSQLRKSRDSYQISADQSSKKLQGFMKEWKKVLMSSEGKNGTKYKEFIKKYAIFTKVEEQEIKKRYSETIQGGMRFSIFPFTMEPRTEKYEDLVIQIMKKFSNKSFTDEQYNDIQQKVIKVSQRFTELHHKDSLLSGQIVSLKENLQKKVKNLEEVRMSFPRKSR